jgi:hypothetical protein
MGMPGWLTALQSDALSQSISAMTTARPGVVNGTKVYAPVPGGGSFLRSLSQTRSLAPWCPAVVAWKEGVAVLVRVAVVGGSSKAELQMNREAVRAPTMSSLENGYAALTSRERESSMIR